MIDFDNLKDYHAHYTSEEYLDFLDKHSALLEDGFPIPKYDYKEHLALMDELGIKWSLLSVSTPQPYFDGFDEESRKMCRKLNEDMAELKAKYPSRFGFQAILPLPNVEAAIEEAIYCLDVLHADGVKLASNSRGLYLGDSSLDVLMDELNKRNVMCNIHPHRPEPIKEGVFSAGPVPLFEFLSDTTRAVLNLIANGVIERYPNIKWIVPHCGSFLPNIYDRFVGMSKILVPLKMMNEIDIKNSFSKLYYDTSGNPAPNLLNWLLTITTKDHILYGSDYPFTPSNQVKGNLEALKQLGMRNEE